jgi:hypothetical protein
MAGSGGAEGTSLLMRLQGAASSKYYGSNTTSTSVQQGDKDDSEQEGVAHGGTYLMYKTCTNAVLSVVGHAFYHPVYLCRNGAFHVIMSWFDRHSGCTCLLTIHVLWNTLPTCLPLYDNVITINPAHRCVLTKSSHLYLDTLYLYTR